MSLRFNMGSRIVHFSIFTILACFGCNGASGSGATTTAAAGGAGGQQPLSPPAESCPVSGSNFTGTWSNAATDTSTLVAVSISGNLITLFKTPCGDIPVAAASVQSDGTFSYVRPQIKVDGVITAGTASGTISNSSNCTTARSWSAGRITNDNRAFVSFNIITGISSSPKRITASVAGFTETLSGGFGLFTTNSQLSITGSGGTVVFWDPVGCSGQTCTFTVNPGVSIYQVNIQ